MRIFSALALAAMLAAITQAQGFTDECSLNFKLKVGGVTGAKGAWEIHPVLKVERVQ